MLLEDTIPGRPPVGLAQPHIGVSRSAPATGSNSVPGSSECGNTLDERREAAYKQWRMCAVPLSADGRMRVSRDGGRTYPGRYSQHVTPGNPGQPATVSVYDPEAQTGRVIAADFDVKRAAVTRTAVPETAVSADAAGLAALVEACGGRAITDVSPNGGRHVYVVFAAALPWLELRDVVFALARRFSTLDATPHASLRGQIRPPGARHRTGGWQELTEPVETVEAVLGAPCGPGVWERLQLELAAELAAQAPAVELGVAAGQQLDDAGQVWVPRVGGRCPLSPAMAELARTGAEAPRYASYASGSEARQAVLTNAAGCGWRLAEVQQLLRTPHGAGLAGFYARYRDASAGRELAADWRKACNHVAGEKNSRESYTREKSSHPPVGGWAEDLAAEIDVEDQKNPWGAPVRCKGHGTGLSYDLTQYQQIRTWWNAVAFVEKRRWTGPHGITTRLVLRALGAAAQMRGSIHIDFGVRSLAIMTGLHHTTVATVLRELRDEPDPVLDVVATGRGIRADLYTLRIPASTRDVAAWRRWRAGRITAIHPAFRELGGPAALAYEALTTEPTRTRDLVDAAALSATATSDALAELAAHGLAERVAGGWRRGSADLDALAHHLGIDTEIAQLLASYRAERRTWAEFLARTTPHSPADIIAVPQLVPDEDELAPAEPPAWLDADLAPPDGVEARESMLQALGQVKRQDRQTARAIALLRNELGASPAD